MIVERWGKNARVLRRILFLTTDWHEQGLSAIHSIQTQALFKGLYKVVGQKESSNDGGDEDRVVYLWDGTDSQCLQLQQVYYENADIPNFEPESEEAFRSTLDPRTLPRIGSVVPLHLGSQSAPPMNSWIKVCGGGGGGGTWAD